MDFRKKIITLQPIDTSEVFIFETNKTFLYFFQNDIIEIINDKYEIEAYKDLYDTLNLSTGLILINSDSIYDKIFELDLGNGVVQTGVFPSGKDKRDRINRFFSFIAVDLMMVGKFQLKVKGQEYFYDKNIIVKKEEGPCGTVYLSFYYDKRKRYFDCVWSLGE